jgi:hypothetical protein
MAAVPVHDDWFYAHSVEILLQRHFLTSGQVTATLVFQILWGALFATVFGMTYGVLRVSTLTMVFLSAAALYALFRQLEVDRARSALGVALYLFNPLAFVLGFTFMSDSHFTALMIVSTLLYVLGLKTDDHRGLCTMAGSLAAALAFLVRQNGILIPLAVASYLVLSGRLRWNRKGLFVLFQATAIPLITACLYYLWLRASHGTPSGQSAFQNNAAGAGLLATFLLTWLLSFMGSMYGGLFLLPLTTAAVPVAKSLFVRARPIGRRGFVGLAAFLFATLPICIELGMQMPYVPSFLNRGGLGPNDLLVARPPLVSRHDLAWLTIFCLASSLILGLILCSRLGFASDSRRSEAGLILVIGLWQAMAIVPPSLSRGGWKVDGILCLSLDRYLLPLLPLLLCLVLWALRGIRVSAPIAWILTAVFALFSIAGTRDYLVLEQATWNLARQANRMGVPNTRLDGGATWDLDRLFEYSVSNRITLQTPPYEYSTGNPDSLLVPAPPWWIFVWTPATDSSYIIVGEPLLGFEVLQRLEYSSWLHRQRTYLYLVRRPSMSTAPPGGAS